MIDKNEQLYPYYQFDQYAKILDNQNIQGVAHLHYGDFRNVNTRFASGRKLNKQD
jgi:hypothetical protein